MDIDEITENYTALATMLNLHIETVTQEIKYGALNTGNIYYVYDLGNCIKNNGGLFGYHHINNYLRCVKYYGEAHLASKTDTSKIPSHIYSKVSAGNITKGNVISIFEKQTRNKHYYKGFANTLTDYISVSRELIEHIKYSMVLLEENPADKANIKSALYAINIIIGSTGMFGYNHITVFIDSAQEALEKLHGGYKSMPEHDDMLPKLQQLVNRLSAL